MVFIKGPVVHGNFDFVNKGSCKFCTVRLDFAQAWLKEGDPLSPLLVVLVINYLGCMVDEAQISSIISPLGNQHLIHRGINAVQHILRRVLYGTLKTFLRHDNSFVRIDT